MPTPSRSARVRHAGPADHEAIHRLNYRTFVEEIPQHPPNAEQRLVDRFHDENHYVVYDVDGVIAGMVCARVQRPFSLDQKLGNIDHYLPPGCRPIEIRLLAVAPPYRSTRVFTSLVGFLTRHFLARGYNTAVISGTTRQLQLYQHLGFRAFGPLIGSDDAWYQPMYLTAADLERWPSAMGLAEPVDDAPDITCRSRRPPANFLPGPVAMRDVVHTAFRALPASHRSETFRHRMRATTDALRALTGARHAALLLGSGTLANDVVAMQLATLGTGGIVVTNGEFGERLADAAVRAGLAPIILASTWGAPLDYAALARALRPREGPPPPWVWATHCETSTGVLNDLARLQELARGVGARLAIDAISSLGTLPVDLSTVDYATGVSGKALGSYPGVAVVLHAAAPRANGGAPRYLDLAFAHAQGGVPFTQSSNLLDALHAALVGRDWPARFARIARSADILRSALAAQGLAVLAPRTCASPAVHTIAVPPGASSQALGDRLRRDGFVLSYESGYLRQRNWVQICLMGEWDDDALTALPPALQRAAGGRRDAAGRREHPPAHAPRAAGTSPSVSSLALR